jgi:hypothetical protein
MIFQKAEGEVGRLSLKAMIHHSPCQLRGQGVDPNVFVRILKILGAPSNSHTPTRGKSATALPRKSQSEAVNRFYL